MDKRLSHLMKLSAKTGDRLIVVPEGKGEPFVLLPVDQYEALFDGKAVSGSTNTVKQVAAEQDLSSPALTDNYEFEPIQPENQQ